MSDIIIANIKNKARHPPTTTKAYGERTFEGEMALRKSSNASFGSRAKPDSPTHYSIKRRFGLNPIYVKYMYKCACTHT